MPRTLLLSHIPFFIRISSVAVLRFHLHSTAKSVPRRHQSPDKMVLSAIHKDNEHGIPHYMGLSGRSLGLAVSTVATCGFLLFG